MLTKYTNSFTSNHIKEKVNLNCLYYAWWLHLRQLKVFCFLVILLS